MFKKLTSLLFSLLLCLSLVPGQACAVDAPDPVDPPAVVEPVGSEDEGIMPMSSPELPNEDSVAHQG